MALEPPRKRIVPDEGMGFDSSDFRSYLNFAGSREFLEIG